MKKLLSVILSCIILFGIFIAAPIETNAFSIRNTAPTRDNRYYYEDNVYYQRGYGLPNCTCYAWGRIYEITGKVPSLPTSGNANTWYTNTSVPYQHGLTPRAGAVICGNFDPYGHVAVVEKVYDDGVHFDYSESNYGGALFNYVKNKTTANFLGFQGFIYATCLTHTWDNGVITTQPTCKKDGEIIYTCTVCGEKKTEIIEHSSKYHSYKVSNCLKATLHTNGKLIKKCEHCGKKIKSTIYRPKTIKLKKKILTYNGKKRKPAFIVKNTKGKTISSKYYNTTYSNNKKVGKATAKIKFKTRYSGTVKRYFVIKPKGTSITTLSAGVKAFTAKWEKKTTQTTGYQLQYATNSKFTKGKKTVTIKSYKTTSKKISKLKANKKYYVRIRTYKKVNGLSYYSGWSEKKSVKTKISTKQKITNLLAGHYLYEDIQVSTSDVKEYEFSKNKTFTIKELSLDYVNNYASSILTEKGNYEIKGDEVILHITDAKTDKGTKLPSYDKVIYYTGDNNFVCSLSRYNSKVCGRKTYYKTNKLSGKNLVSFVGSFLYNYSVEHYVEFKKKTTYYSYLSIIDKCYFFESDDYLEVYYNYLKLKTPYGTQKALVVTNSISYSGSFAFSDIYVINNSNKAIKYKKLPGVLNKYSSSKDYLLSSMYYGDGMGNYTIMKYKKDKKNYVKHKSYDYVMNTRNSVTNTVYNLTKSYKTFNFSKYSLK